MFHSCDKAHEPWSWFLKLIWCSAFQSRWISVMVGPEFGKQVTCVLLWLFLGHGVLCVSSRTYLSHTQICSRTFYFLTSFWLFTSNLCQITTFTLPVLSHHPWNFFCGFFGFYVLPLKRTTGDVWNFEGTQVFITSFRYYFPLITCCVRLWCLALCCHHGAFMWMMSSANNKLDAHVIVSLLITENTVCIQDGFSCAFAARHEEVPQNEMMMNARSFDNRVRGLHCVYLAPWPFLVAWTHLCVAYTFVSCECWIRHLDFLQFYFPVITTPKSCFLVFRFLTLFILLSYTTEQAIKFSLLGCVTSLKCYFMKFNFITLLLLRHLFKMLPWMSPMGGISNTPNWEETTRKMQNTLQASWIPSGLGMPCDCHFDEMHCTLKVKAKVCFVLREKMLPPPLPPLASLSFHVGGDFLPSSTFAPSSCFVL